MLPETSIKELNRRGLLSVRAMNVCNKEGIETLEQLGSIDRCQLLNVRNCGMGTLRELDMLRAKFAEQNTEDSQCDNAYTENNELEIAGTKLEHLSPYIRMELQSLIECRFSGLSKRARNVFPQLSNCADVIRAIYSDNDIQSVEKCGRKTTEEVETYLSQIKQHFEKITAGNDISEDIPEFDWRQEKIAELKREYPFLHTKECEVIAESIRQNGVFPYLYVVKLLILRSENPRIAIYRDYWGFNDSSIRFTLAEIGEKNNITSERVRQLVSKAIPIPNKLKESVRLYLEPLIGNVIAYDNPLWHRIQRENILEESCLQTARLAASLLDTYTFIQIDDNDKEYLVKRSIIENVSIRNTLRSMSRIIELRHTTVERLDIMDHLIAEGKSYHKDVSQLCVIYSDFLKRKYRVEIENDRIVIVYPNTLDIPAIIENILRQKNTPMALDELLEAFNQLYPANALDSTFKLKYYLLHNKNIIPKGKTGIYLLKDWKSHFAGTLTDYLKHILGSFDEPVLLDDLVEFALDEFPNTNKKSIYSIIVMDKDKQFVIYEGEYIGLANSMFVDFCLKKRKITRRCSFEVHFADLRKFVSTHKRFPTLNGTEEERSLVRWLANVLKSRIHTTEEQLASLQKFLDDNKGLPQNGGEYDFSQMCDRIKNLVSQTHTLPNRSEHMKEYQWLRKHLKNYITYEGNRKAYFEDLLMYLRDFGFSLG